MRSSTARSVRPLPLGFKLSLKKYSRRLRPPKNSRSRSDLSNELLQSRKLVIIRVFSHQFAVLGINELRCSRLSCCFDLPSSFRCYLPPWLKQQLLHLVEAIHIYLANALSKRSPLYCQRSEPTFFSSPFCCMSLRKAMATGAIASAQRFCNGSISGGFLMSASRR